MQTKSIVLLVLVIGFAGLAAIAIVTAPAENEKNGKLITTASGLQYIDVKLGAGRDARTGDFVTVYYTGTFKDGKVFDSNQGKKPHSFILGARKVIRGWDEGLVGMKEGGRRKLFIPSKLAYGPDGFGDVIPPDTDLIFEVELLNVK